MTCRHRLPVTLVALGTLALAGCAAPAPTAVPAVTVHVRNLVSNVVVTAIDLHPDGVQGTPATDGYGFVAPCGGEVELRAPLGDVALALDPDGDLDRIYATGDADPADVPSFEISIMWADSGVPDGTWLTITPTKVAESTESDAPVLIDPDACLPWSHPPE